MGSAVVGMGKRAGYLFQVCLAARMPKRSRAMSRAASAVSPRFREEGDKVVMERVACGSILFDRCGCPEAASVVHQRRRNPVSELIVYACRNPLQPAAGKAVWTAVGYTSGCRIERGHGGRIVAVRVTPWPPEVIVGSRMVDRHCPVRIERSVLVQRMPPGRVHVGGIVRVGAAGGVVLTRVARCRAGVCPADTDAVLLFVRLLSGPRVAFAPHQMKSTRGHASACMICRDRTAQSR